MTRFILVALLRAQSGSLEQSWDVPGVEVDDHVPEVLLVSGKRRPWQVEMVANFKGHSSPAPILVAVLDGESPEALQNHQALVVWDVNMKPNTSLGMRLLLTVEQGFPPSHSYVLRVVRG